jgi:hypothetical protein
MEDHAPSSFVIQARIGSTAIILAIRGSTIATSARTHTTLFSAKPAAETANRRRISFRPREAARLKNEGATQPIVRERRGDE